MFANVAGDIRAVKERDPAARNTLEIVLCYSGLHAILAHRVNHWLWTHGLRMPARVFSQTAKVLTGIEIHPGARIGKGFFIDHGTGTVIGETAEVGDNCTLFHGVTLGGTGKETGKRHPTLADSVTIGAHAQIIGAIEIGEGSVVGAGAVVLDPVPDYCTVVGTKAYVVRRRGERVYDFRHDGQPRIENPEVERLRARLRAIEEELDALRSSCAPVEPLAEPTEDALVGV